MKKFISTFAMVIFGITMAFAQGKDQLPEKANTLIKDHYSAEKVEKVNTDKDNNKITSFEVQLSNNILMEFDANGELMEIRSDNAIPDKVLPANIVSYVKENYNGSSIMEYEKEDDGQEVELDNGMELEFDASGKFLKED